MIDYHKELVSSLNNILPTYYELNLTKECTIPCISYMLRNDYSTNIGDTLGYGIIQYQVKVWSNKQEDLQNYSQQIDNSLRLLGFKRVSTGELYDVNSAMKQKILVYEALYNEYY